MKRIKIVSYTTSHLALRANADMLFDKIELLKDNKVVIDFSDVLTVSRSFADQYIKCKNKSSKIIREENVPENIRRMFDIVKYECEPYTLKFESVETIP